MIAKFLILTDSVAGDFFQEMMPRYDQTNKDILTIRSKETGSSELRRIGFRGNRKSNNGEPCPPTGNLAVRGD